MKTGTPVTVSVYAINGRMVHRLESVGRSTMVLSLQKLTKGTYIVNLNSGSHEVGTMLLLH